VPGVKRHHKIHVEPSHDLGSGGSPAVHSLRVSSFLTDKDGIRRIFEEFARNRLGFAPGSFLVALPGDNYRKGESKLPAAHYMLSRGV
jgi:hypothetical protein